MGTCEGRVLILCLNKPLRHYVCSRPGLYTHKGVEKDYLNEVDPMTRTYT